MSWRTIQLGDQLCDQDKLILNLFKDQTVRYVGADTEFAQHLSTDSNSTNLILILNQSMWVSELISCLHKNLRLPVTTFYIGINRYTLLGNDTDLVLNSTAGRGNDIIEAINKIITNTGYTITKHGTHDNDCGRYFNFVQPLTWIYGSYDTNKSI